MKSNFLKITLQLCSLVLFVFCAFNRVASAQSATPTLVTVNSTGTGGGNNNVGFNAAVSRNGRYVVFTASSNMFTPNPSGATVFVRDLQAGITTPVDVSYNGTVTNNWADYPSISADGRYVAFSSYASNLVPNDTNGQPDVFVRDMTAKTTRNICVTTSGAQFNRDSTSPLISGDGSRIVFRTSATNWTTNDSNGIISDVLACSVNGGGFTNLSVYSGSQPSSDGTIPTSISYNGAYVTITSPASNLCDRDGNGRNDVFLSGSGALTLVSQSRLGSTSSTPSGDSWEGSVSDDGRYVCFASIANDVRTTTPYPSSSNINVFLEDMTNSSTLLLSKATSNVAANGSSSHATMSGNGRYVIFYSGASNLVPNDINNQADLFVYDAQAPSTTYMKTIYLGKDGDHYYGDSLQTYPRISADGTLVAFPSSAQLNAIPTNNWVNEYAILRP